jgi:undecaprenyl-diphosphatase
MEPLPAITLGIIQGLTEFLPISSSGHLVIFQHLFGMEEPELFFDICVHIGTLVAVIIYFWKDLWSIITALSKRAVPFLLRKASFKDTYKDPDIKLAVLIVIGTVPTVIIGLLLKKISDQLFSSLIIVGCMLIITGIFLWSTRWIKKQSKGINRFSVKDSVIIGIIQGLAIAPGISRSGSTIAVGLFLGLSRETAAKYSFLLSIPAIIGAMVLILKDLTGGAVVQTNAVVLGGVTSCIVGYCSLKFLVFIVKKGQMHLFAPYCWLVGSLAIIWGL